MKKKTGRIIAVILVLAMTVQQGMPAVFAAENGNKTVPQETEIESEYESEKWTEKTEDAVTVENQESESETGTPESESETSRSEGESETVKPENESETSRSESESETGVPESESETSQSESESETGVPESESETSQSESESETERLESESETSRSESESETMKPESESETSRSESESETVKPESESETSRLESESETGHVSEVMDDAEAETGKEQELLVGAEVGKEPELLSLTASIHWVDADNQAEERPETIRVRLIQHHYDAGNVCIGSQEKKRATLRPANGWKATFSGLPQDDSQGGSYTYEVTAEEVPGYTMEINGYEIVYTYAGEPEETVDVSGSITWRIGNDPYDQPDSVMVYLMADGKQYDSIRVTEADGWQWEVLGAPKYNQAGEEIDYRISVWSDRDSWYKKEIDRFQVTYYAMRQCNVRLFWEDFRNSHQTRPESVTVHVMNGETLCQSREVMSADQETDTGVWEWYRLDMLPLYDENGNEIQYTLKVDPVPGYTITLQNNGDMSGYFTDVVLHHEDMDETVSVTGDLRWEDNDNAAGKRPGSVLVCLKEKNASDYIKKTWIFEENNWTWSFDDLPKYDGFGNEISYEAYIEKDLSYYKVVMNGNTAVAAYVPYQSTIEGGIVWKDRNDAAGKRPERVWVGLKRYGFTEYTSSVNATGEQWSFSGVPIQDENGNKIIYDIVVYNIPGYVSQYDGQNVILTYIGETSVNCKIKWQKDEGQESKRPDNLWVTLKNGAEICGEYLLSETNNWSCQSDHLPQYDADGNEIQYTLSVDGRLPHYKKEIVGTEIVYTLLDETEKVDITVKESWEGGGPWKAHTILLMDGDTVCDSRVLNYWWDEEAFAGVEKYRADGSEIPYTVALDRVPEDYRAEIQGYDIVFTYEKEPEIMDVAGSVQWEDNEDQEGLRPDTVTVTLYEDAYQGAAVAKKTVNAKEDWKYVFEDLPKYRNGQQINYKVTAEDTPAYTWKGALNAWLDEDYNLYFTLRESDTTYDINVFFEDADNAEDMRPEGIQVSILSDGVRKGGDYLRLPEEKGSSFTFERVMQLPEYRAGRKIYYQLKCKDVEGYSIRWEKTAFGWSIYLCATSKIRGSVNWDDEDDQDGKRPESIKVHLMNGETEVAVQTVTEADEWEWLFDDAKRYDENGAEIPYTVVADDIPEYEKQTEDGEVTFTHAPEMQNISTEIIWKDEENRDGIRPDCIDICLKNGTEELETVTVAEEDNWKSVFEDYPKYENGEEICYTLEVEEIPDYTVSFDSYNIICTHEPERAQISGKIVWDDKENKDGKRPKYVNVYLMNGKKKAAEKEVAESDGWKWTFSEVPKYEKGEEIDYTIQIGGVSGYRVKISKKEVRLIYDKKEQTLPPETEEAEPEEPDTEESETETQSSENKREETETGSSESESTQAESVKTGDTSNIEMYLLLFMTAVLIGAGAAIYRRRRV